MSKKLLSTTHRGINQPSLLLLLVFCFYTPFAFSDDIKIHPDAGKTSATFLKIGAGARAAAMAGAFSGIADDATAIYWNPAGLMQTEDGTFEINASHNEWFESIRHDFVGFSYKKKNSPIAWGGAIYGLYTQPDIERRTGGIKESDPFEPLTPVEGYFGAYDIALSFGAAYRPKKPLLLGGNIKLINQTIDNYSGFAGAIDVGAIYQQNGLSPLLFAAVIQNAGTPLKLDQKSYPLPFTVRLSSSYRKKGDHPFNLSFETAIPIDNYPFFYLGGEYFVAKIFALRAGYRYRLYGLELGDINGFTAGAGIKLPIMKDRYEVSLDYAFNPYGVLGNSHRLSASVKFGFLSSSTSPLRKTSSTGKIQQSPKHPSPITIPALPSLPQTQNTLSSSSEEKQNITYLPTKIILTPKVISNISTLAEFSATPITDGDKTSPIIKVTGMIKTRTIPRSNEDANNIYGSNKEILFEVGSQIIKHDSLQEKLGLFFKQHISGQMENLTVYIAIPSAKKIKSVSRLINTPTTKPLPLPFELKSTDGQISYYEIKSPTLTDMIIEFSQE